MGLCFVLKTPKTFDGLNNFRMPEYRNKMMDGVVENELLHSRTEENSGSPSPDVHHISSTVEWAAGHMFCALTEMVQTCI